jgi:hypothetical protein
MQKDMCPNGSVGCVARKNKMWQICKCAFSRGVKLCFECIDFPCETTRKGSISYVTASSFQANPKQKTLVQ